MKLNINLASRPYEDARQFYLQWVPLLVVLFALAIFLSVKAWMSFQDSRWVDRQLAEQNGQLAKFGEERKVAEATLARPENSGTRDEAQFLNELFARKAFSWTEVLMDLEKLVPPGLQIVSIKPELNPDSQLQFTMVVSSDRRDSAIELVRRMEVSPRFRQAYIHSEIQHEDANDRKIKNEIVALYVPDLQGGTK